MTQDVSLEQGRPLLVMIRVPDSVEYCESIGIDLERWLKEGLTDLLVVGGDYRLNRWEESVALGQKYDIPVYACLIFTGRSSLPEYRLRSDPKAYRARAMNAWHAGVDGVYLFNQFDPKAPQWRELGDPAKLEGLDKIYYGTTVPSTHLMRYHADGPKFHNLPRLSPDYPETLRPGTTVTTTLTVGENLAASKRRGIVPELRLGLRVSGLADAGGLTVTLNGCDLTKGALAAGWLEYAPEPEWVYQGVNEIQLRLHEGSVGEPEVSDVRLHVAYGR